MTTTQNGFELIHNDENGYTSFRSSDVELTRYRPGMAWEFYTIAQKGSWKGRPRFVRFLTEAEGKRLTDALDSEMALRRIRARGGMPERFVYPTAKYYHSVE